MNSFRLRRNEIIHTGYSRKNDEECLDLILNAGFPFYKSLCLKYFSWDVTIDFGGRVTEGFQMMEKLKRHHAISSAFEIVFPLSFHVNELLQEDRLSELELEYKRASHYSRGEVVLGHVMDDWYDSALPETIILTDCPICKEETLLIEFNETLFGKKEQPYESKKLVPEALICGSCNMWIKNSLATAIFEVSFTPEKRDILKWSLFENDEFKGKHFSPEKHNSLIASQDKLNQRLESIRSEFNDRWR